MKKVFVLGIILIMGVVLALGLAACGEKETPATYRDGVYEGRSRDFQADESGVGAGYGVVSLELKNNEVVSCTFTMYELDGTIKDDTYGADLSRENRIKAQKAVQSAPKYAQMLLEKKNINDVTVISGATISHDEFVEAVLDALSKAIVE